MFPTVVRILATAVLLAAGIIWTLSMWPQHVAQGQEAKRYVYKVVDVPADHMAMQTVLNEYGAAGWELILIGMGDMTTPRLVFKK
jgi:hypothetical protein